MRCPDCCKFVGLETDEPEENSIDVTNNDDGTLTITASATVNRCCADCSSILKSADFDLEDLVLLDADAKHKGHEISVDSCNWELLEDSAPKPKQVKSRKTGKLEWCHPNPRYVRSLFGVKVTGTVSCDSCDDFSVDFECVSGMIGAGEFEEQV